MDTLQIAAQMVRDAVSTMSAKFSAFTKAGLAEKQDVATMPTKVSDFTNDSGFQNAQQVEDAIDAKISSAYKAGGSATMATLPALSAAKLGVVVNMSENFTTTADFLEGAGKSYPAGTNVVVALAGENVYKYDVLAGFVDLSGYVQDTRKVGNVPLSADIPVSLTGDSAIAVTNTGTASAIGYSITLKDSGVTAGSKGDATNQRPGFGETFKTLSATVDAKGRLTALNENNVTIPNAAATTSAAGLMSASDKSKLDNVEAQANKTTIDNTLSNSGDAADAKATGDKITALESENALLRELINGIDAPIYRTASGNPATFSDAKAANVRDLTVTLTPTQSGSGDPSPANVRPISGVSSVTVTRTGKNLLYYPYPYSSQTTKGVTFVNNADGSVTLNGTATSGIAYFLARTGTGESIYPRLKLPVGDYVLSDGVNQPEKAYIYAVIYKNGQNILDGRAASTQRDPESPLLILPEYDFDAIPVVLMVTSGQTFDNVTFRPMIRPANVGDSAWEPYQGASVTVPLVDSGDNPLTVYGGTLDVTAGTLTVTWVNIASYDDETLPGRWISDRDVYAPDATPTAGAQVIYELAAPLTYQLTPAQLATLAGYNSVSTDAGSVTVEYRADVALSLDALESNLTNALLSLGAGF